MELQVNKNEKKDIEAYRSLKESRNVCIRQGSKKRISTEYPLDVLSSKLHPDFFYVRVKEIIAENECTKTFVLEASLQDGTHHLPMYEAGQYITLEVGIGEGVYQRAYSISCSPSHLRKNNFQITIQSVPTGIVSNYFLEKVNVGDTFLARGPFGEFTYHELRDYDHVLAIVNGSGIAPIFAMAESISEGLISAEMTILYQAKSVKDLIFKEKLDELAKSALSLRVVYILENEEVEGYVHGTIDKDFIQKYQKSGNSYFVCGDKHLYESMNEILKELNVPNKYIRHDFYIDYDIPTSMQEYEMTILMRDKELHVSCYGNQTLLQILEREGIVIPRQCGVGVCGVCKSKLLEGEVLTKKEKVSAAGENQYYIHPCSTYPLSDIIIQLP